MNELFYGEQRVKLPKMLTNSRLSHRYFNAIRYFHILVIPIQLFLAEISHFRSVIITLRVINISERHMLSYVTAFRNMKEKPHSVLMTKVQTAGLVSLERF